MKNYIVIAALFSLFSCGEDATAPSDEDAVRPDKIHVNKFLTYLNTQASLPAGQYQLRIDSSSDLLSADYAISIKTQDETLAYNSQWSADQDEYIEVNLLSPGGILVEMNSTPGMTMALYRNGQRVSQLRGTNHNGQAELHMATSKISSESYSKAYYQAVDPNNRRDTLAGWLSENGFDNDEGTYVVFRDTKDLGYGRSMYARRRDDGGVAIYVDNYVVKLGGPSPSNYGPLNVHAAVDQNRYYHAGTNAIEFSPIDETDENSPMAAKFFTFAPADRKGKQVRLLEADLDGRGIKPVPTTCISCHGGAMLPLNAQGEIPRQALLSPKLNQLEVDTFEFSALAGFSREEQEDNLRFINQLIASTFTIQQSQNNADEDSALKGKWSADFALELANGRYGNDFSQGEYEVQFVPSGWKQNGTRPAGVETLYKTVIEPHCVSCHSLRGSEIGEQTTVAIDGELISLANAVNFSSYEKFISFSDRITDYVYRRGQMPLSLRNYEKFWRNPQGKPTLLASFLPGFDVVNEFGEIQQPQRPWAKIAAANTMTAPSVLVGQQSLFAAKYQWQLVASPADASFEIGELNQANLMVFNASEGEYEFELIVENAQGQRSEPSRIKVNFESSEVVDGLTFVDQIRTVMGARDNSSCSLCHREDSDYPNIPAYYADSNPGQYQDVLARVDFSDPLNSPILIKPTTLQHGGGVVIDRETLAGEADYQTLLRWILNGAPCGDDPHICQ